MKKLITTLLALVLISYGIFGNGLLDLLDNNNPLPSPEPEISILNIDKPSDDIIDKVKNFGELIKDPTDRAKIAIFNYEFANRVISYETNLQQVNDVYVLAGKTFFNNTLVGKYKDLPKMIVSLINDVTGEENHILSEQEKLDLNKRFMGLAWVFNTEGLINGPQKISSIIHSLFEGGYKTNNFNIVCKSPTVAEMVTDDNGILIEFVGNLPVVEIKRFITFNLSVEGISFGVNGGIIKIKNFPDMPFSYEENNSFPSIYGSNINIDVPEEEINSTFKSESKRKIASKCLQYAREWATIASLNGVRFDSYDKFDAFVLKKKCYYFVEDQVKKDKDLQYGSIISIFILSLILPTIIKWAVDRILRSLLT